MRETHAECMRLGMSANSVGRKTAGVCRMYNYVIIKQT